MYDPRIGRFFASDPLERKFSHWSPYAFSGNQVIHTIELEGLETEENLNSNEIETAGSGGEELVTASIGARQGVEGDCAGCSGNEDWEFYSPIMVVKISPIYQVQNFAEAIDGTAHVNGNDMTKSYVSVCENSVVGVEVQMELQETMGIDFENLTRSEKKELMKVRWTKDDMSELFTIVESNIIMNRTIALPYAGVAARPVVVVPRGGGFSSSNASVSAQELGRTIVSQFAKTAKGRRAKRKAAKSTKSSDSEYNEESEHKSNQTQSNKPKHEKGQKRKGKDKGGEKGDKRRTRHK